MHGKSPRFDVILDLKNRVPRHVEVPRDEQGRKLAVSEYFGVNTFGMAQMRDKLPSDVFQKLRSTIEHGKKLDPEIANVVAHAIQEWALSRGVTHFCHWFQPQTGSTAEKHDAFLTFAGGDGGGHHVIEKFSGAQLIQSEPDASSFPSGGMRTTFEARGYTAWDPSSPVFIMEAGGVSTLCVPSVFISYHGDALDEKTALVRSVEVLSVRATELLAVIGQSGAKRVVPTLGAEQEYFLIDRAFYMLRPDLVMAGRTVVGGQPPKGQQLEDHYFGSIPARVLAFMAEMEHELYKLGVPVKTRHNEVAPSQFETAPIFEEVNLSTDHNQLTMEVLRKVAQRHGMACLLHEKPFAGVNGSGKHNNWSMQITGGGDLDGQNLLDPGKTPHQNLRFLLVVMGVLKGVHKHAGLLRAGIASSGNDHRLGANEAPPAIISVFLGDMLSRILDEIEKGGKGSESGEAAVIRLGVMKLPEVMKDNTDRNRTSPFAFTGNKFEFRAVGSSASTAFPITLLNAAVADGLAELTGALKAKMSQNKSADAAILEVVREAIPQTKAVRFEGNNYAQEWVAEADKRGLPNLRKTPEALKQLITPASKKMLVESGVFSDAELHSRFHVRLERYIKDVAIEVETLTQIVDTMILPAALTYHGKLAAGAAAAKTAGFAAAPQKEGAERLAYLCDLLQTRRKNLVETFTKADAIEDHEAKAASLAQEVTQVMNEVRRACDELEGIVADASWPLPKYREMLFLSLIMAVADLIDQLIPEKQGTSQEIDAIAEIAYLTIAADRKLDTEEIEAFRRVIERLRGQKLPDGALDRVLDEMYARAERARSDEGERARYADDRLRALAAKMSTPARELAYRVAYAMGMADMDSSDEEFEFDLQLVDALELPSDRAEQLQDEVMAVLNAE